VPILNLANSDYFESVADEIAKAASRWRGSMDENCRPEKDIAPKQLTDRTPNPEQLYWAPEFRDVLAQTPEEVRPSLRVVFVLREIKGLSINQTSIVLGLSHTAVKVRLWRARLQIRDGLSERYKQKPKT
jgi:RNA polymerase sigma factor (sigma-70 family)